MDKRKQRALEAAGWRFGDIDELLGLTPDEMQMIELRVALCRTIHRLRAEQGMSQQQLAAKIESSQSRVAKLEVGVGVSLDLMFRALFALGGTLADLAVPGRKRVRKARVRS